MGCHDSGPQKEEAPTQLPFIPSPAPNMGWDDWNWSKNYDN
jgi:hypothetical protein